MVSKTISESVNFVMMRIILASNGSVGLDGLWQDGHYDSSAVFCCSSRAEGQHCIDDRHCLGSHHGLHCHPGHHGRWLSTVLLLQPT